LQIRNIANATLAPRDVQVSGSTASSSTESLRIKDDVEAARNTAMSALTNDRFRAMLEQITDPAVSGVLMTMSGDAGSATPDLKTAQSRYAENSE
jgi:hypothetical protein